MANLALGRHKVSTGSQAIVSRPDVPRSTFSNSSTHKTTFDADYLVPIYLEEIIPGDSLQLDVTAFVRMATPVFPVMDNLYVDTFFFFIPNRLVWDRWHRFMGERVYPDASIDFLIPEKAFASGSGVEVGSIYDYFGIPTKEQADGGFAVNALPLRCYNLVFNEWFRDENIQHTAGLDRSDGPDSVNYALIRRGKRHDYFTSALPWPQKGNAVSLPLSGSAPVIGTASTPLFATTFGNPGTNISSSGAGTNPVTGAFSASGPLFWGEDTGLEADLTDVLAVSINTMRAAVATQQLLERDARGGTRYTELLTFHFGVYPEDSRLQRPEYLGGSSAPLNVTPVAQTSGTPEVGTPLGSLGGAALTTGRSRITHSFPEHGYVIGLINVRADLSYQQGLHRTWTRRTRYDYPWPIFANLGEQAVRQDEIFLSDSQEENETVFGYQERYAEYRYRPSLITGKMRSGISGTLDSWHLAQHFETAPVLEETGFFIESITPMDRILAAGELAEKQQFYADILFNQRLTRPLPTRGTPGLVRF